MMKIIEFLRRAMKQSSKAESKDMLAAKRLLSDFRQDEGMPSGIFSGFHKFRIQELNYEKCRLLRYVFSHFLDFEIHDQPFEKVNWEIPFKFRGIRGSCAHQKFGFRIYIDAAQSIGKAQSLFDEIMPILKKAIEIAAFSVKAEGIEMLKDNKVIVDNNLRALEKRYAFFKDEANKREQKNADIKHFDFNKHIESTYFADAAYISYFSLIEHLCILALPFSKDAKKQKLIEFSELNWSGKFKIVFPLNNTEIKKFYDYLNLLSKFRRNPTVHGYLDKLNTIFHFYCKDARHRIPMSIYDRDLLSEISKTEVNFDKLDSFLDFLRKDKATARMMQYLDEDFDIGYDEKSLSEYELFQSLDQNEASEFIKYRQMMLDDMANMDW